MYVYSKSLILKLIVILDVIIPSGQSGVMLNTSISPQSPWLSSRSQFVQLLLRIFFFASTQTVANLRAIAFSLGAKPIRQTSRLLFAMQMISSPQTNFFFRRHFEKDSQKNSLQCSRRLFHVVASIIL